MLRNAKVKKYISELQKPIILRSQTLAERVKSNLENIAFSDISHFINSEGRLKSLGEIKDLPTEITSSIESLEVTKYGLRIKLVRKVPALELLMKHLGMFDELLKKPEKSVAEYSQMPRAEFLAEVEAGIAQYEELRSRLLEDETIN